MIDGDAEAGRPCPVQQQAIWSQVIKSATEDRMAGPLDGLGLPEQKVGRRHLKLSFYLSRVPRFSK